MKRTVSLVLSLILMFSFALNAFAWDFGSVPDVAATDVMYAEQTINGDNTVTYTVYLKDGMEFSGVINHIVYDKTLLTVKEADVLGDYNSGMVTMGVSVNSDAYTIAVVNGNEAAWTTESNGNQIMKITFENISSAPTTEAVSIYCIEFNSKIETQNIPNSIDNPKLINAFEFAAEEPSFHFYDYENPVNVVPATCTSTGSVTYVCSCGAEKTDILPELEHTEASMDFISPTCTKHGRMGGTYCSVCKEVLEEPSNIARLGHAYKNGACIRCDGWQHKNSTVKLVSVKNTATGVLITWNKLQATEDYLVYRKTGSGKWTKIATVKGTSYTDENAKNNVKYSYTVKSKRGSEYSKYNTKGLAITYMSAPKVSSVTNATSGVTVKWGKVSGATTYYVYRKTTGGWTKLGSTKSTSFTDKKAKAGTTYTYTVIAAKSGAKSSYTSGKKVTRLTNPKLTKLTASKGKNTLTFGKVTGASSYYVYRKTGNGSWKRIATVKSLKYIDKKVKKGIYYTYTVRAVRGSYTSYYNTKGLKVRAK